MELIAFILLILICVDIGGYIRLKGVLSRRNIIIVLLLFNVVIVYLVYHYMIN